MLPVITTRRICGAASSTGTSSNDMRPIVLQHLYQAALPARYGLSLSPALHTRVGY